MAPSVVTDIVKKKRRIKKNYGKAAETRKFLTKINGTDPTDLRGKLACGLLLIAICGITHAYIYILLLEKKSLFQFSL